MRARLEVLVEEMLEGNLLLDEALSEFEKLYIRKGLERNNYNLSKTASALGVHRNTIAKRLAAYQKQDRPLARAKASAR